MKRTSILSRNTSLFDKPQNYRVGIQPAKGIFVKSKIEYILFTSFKSAELDFEYEKPLHMKKGRVIIHPDFTININGSTFYIEHLGKLDIRTYSQLWQERLDLYKRNKMFSNLITTDDLNGLDKTKIINLIEDLKTQKIINTPKSNFSGHHYQLY